MIIDKRGKYDNCKKLKIKSAVIDCKKYCCPWDKNIDKIIEK